MFLACCLLGMIVSGVVGCGGGGGGGTPADSGNPVVLGSTLTNMADGQSVIAGLVTLSGTASDPYGVAKVEVSLDGGSTWLLADGTTAWSYTWDAPEYAAYDVQSRAYSVHGEVESPGPAVVIHAVRARLPGSTILEPRDAQVITGSTIEVYGVAYGGDADVVRVEVSFDGGTTWLRAKGATFFTYTYTVPSPGLYNIRSRVINTDGVVEVPKYSVNVTLQP